VVALLLFLELLELDLKLDSPKNINVIIIDENNFYKGTLLFLRCKRVHQPYLTQKFLTILTFAHVTYHKMWDLITVRKVDLVRTISDLVIVCQH
jgi:hypothetical protein